MAQMKFFISSLPVTQSIPKLVFPLSVNYTIPDAHAKNF